jgi:ABC-type Fe3+-citrate transport system substrate-binding protein
MKSIFLISAMLLALVAGVACSRTNNTSYMR